MSDTDNTPKATRARVSRRDLVNAEGGEAERMEDAVGGNYVLLDPNGDHTFNYTFGDNSDKDRMLAIFGFHTKIGNVGNTTLNDADSPGGPADAAASIAEFIALLDAGKWAERTGVGAPKYDKDALAASIIEVAGANAKMDLAGYRAKLDSERGYASKVLRVPEISRAYAAKAGKAAVTLDSVL